MNKRLARAGGLSTMGVLAVSFFIMSGTVAQERGAMQYKVISTQDFVKTANPKPSERMRVEILNDKDAKNVNGILASLPPASVGAKLVYHYHKSRESIIQILSGDATEMVEGKPVRLKPGEVIFIPPNVKHTLVNNSSTQELRYMEFFSPIAADSVQVKD